LQDKVQHDHIDSMTAQQIKGSVLSLHEVNLGALPLHVTLPEPPQLGIRLDYQHDHTCLSWQVLAKAVTCMGLCSVSSSIL
jgi:hypothetical protein